MFVTLALLYFAVTTGYQIGAIVLGAVVFIDLVTLATINNVAEIIFGTDSSNEDLLEEP